MPSTVAKIPVNSLTSSFTLDVEIVGYQGWLVRLKIALWLIGLACKVAGMGVKFNGLKDAEELSHGDD